MPIRPRRPTCKKPNAPDPKVGTCALCLEANQSLVRSHIVSDFFFRDLKKADGRYYVLSTDASIGERAVQKGIREHLLCPNCDNVILSGYETYLRQFIFGGATLAMKDDGRTLSVREFDYRLLKNGLLSLLWRMHLSSDPFFDEIELLASDAERIRCVLLHGEVLAEYDYGITAAAPLLKGEFHSEMILQPDRVDDASRRIYRCPVGGFVFAYMAFEGPPELAFRPFILRGDEWNIVRMAVEQLPFLNDAYLRLSEASNLRAARSSKK